MIAISLIAGLLVGLSLGGLGGGGAIITVPVLVYGLGQSAHEATTASLVIVGVTAWVSALSHTRAGRVRWGQGLLFGLLGTVGTAAGSHAAAGLNPNAILVAFAGLLLVVAALMWRRAGRLGLTSEPGPRLKAAILAWSPQFRCNCSQLAMVVATATGVGLLTGFFGVGGGFAVVPALVIALSFDMPVAIGTSLVVIGVNSATALAARLSAGIELDWTVVALFTIAAMAGGVAGSAVMAKASPARLQRMFASLLVPIAVYIVAHSALTA